MPELPGLAGDPLGVAVGAHGLGDVGAGALGDEAPGTDLIARRPRDRQRLPGERRLVQRQAIGGGDPPVRDDLVAGADREQVAGHDPRPPGAAAVRRRGPRWRPG